MRPGEPKTKPFHHDVAVGLGMGLPITDCSISIQCFSNIWTVMLSSDDCIMFSAQLLDDCIGVDILHGASTTLDYEDPDLIERFNELALTAVGSKH